MNIKLKWIIRTISLAFVLILLARSASSQTPWLENKYPATLYSPNDSFAVKFSYTSDKSYLQFKDKDTVDMGSDGAAGLSATIFYGKDSVNIPYNNLPFTEVYWINLQSPNARTVYRLHFNKVTASFTEGYIRENTNNTQFEIPEVYELANIIWTISPSGQRANNLNKEGEYYKKVMAYFKPFLNHPIFKKLDLPEDDYMGKYYDFRENSFCYSFNNEKIEIKGPYYYVSGNNWENHNSLFKELLPLTEDFAEKSNFRKFYKDNEEYYNTQIKEEEIIMPVKKMWAWLEDQFPDRYNSYKVVFSPLISASHSTQNFGTFINNIYFSETVMFVAGPGIFEKDKQITAKQKEGLASGIVFTEIDHNYVNPISYKYKRIIDSIFSRRDIWTSSGGDTKFYDNPMAVFNEYMTHAVFCLYILDNYNQADADFIIKVRESLMVNVRHYIKFKEFNQTLIDLYKKDRNTKVSLLFNQILIWCRTQI